MKGLRWYEKLLLSLAAAASAAAVVEWVRPGGDGFAYAFLAPGLAIFPLVTIYSRREPVRPRIVRREVVLIGAALIALVVSIVEFVRADGDSGRWFSLAAMVLVVADFVSLILRSEPATRSGSADPADSG